MKCYVTDYRRIVQAKYTDKIEQEEILKKAGRKEATLKKLKKRRDQLLRHVITRNRLLRDV